MTPPEIMAKVNELAGHQPVLISLSGGNPALQPLAPLIALGRRDGHSFALETQGSVEQAWFADLNWLIISPKPPSSGMTTDWTALKSCIAAAKDRARCALKIVVFNEQDYAYAQTVAVQFPALPIYLQVGNLVAPHTGAATSSDDFSDLMGRLRWLAERTVKDKWFDATVLPQLHVLAWGNKRGV